MSTLPTLLSRGRLLAALLIAGVLAGCGAPTAATPTAVPLATAPAGATSAPAPTAAPTAAPVPTAEPTTAPAAGLLPAPLYILNAEQQIVRLEADGKTSTQITNEAAPISGFAVSPADGTLLYIVGQPVPNQLVRADARGGNRAELLTGQVTPPVWSPDGQRYAFGWANGPQGPGVYVAGKAGEPTLLVANLARPQDGATPGQLRTPLAWSPDGQRLLLVVAPDNGPDAPGGDIAVIGVSVVGSDGKLTELVRSGGDPHMCFSAAWSSDGSQVYCASYGMSGGAPALWRIPAAGGKPEILVAADNGSGQTDVFNPVAVDGQLYAFVGATKESGQTIDYTMQRFDEQSGAASNVRADAFDINAVLWSLWAPDGSGAVTQKAEQDSANGYTLVWVPASGEPVQLSLRGAGTPQWGASQ